MAKKRIEHSDLFEPKITEKLINELDDLVTKGAATKDSLIEIRDALREINEIKTAEQFKRFTAETKKLEDAQKELIKIEKDQGKVKSKIFKEALNQHKKIEKERLDEIKLQKAREKAFDNFEKEQKKNAQAELKRLSDIKKAEEAVRLAGIKSAKDRERALANLEKQKQKDIKISEKERLSELRLQKDRERAFDRADKEIKKQAAAAKKLAKNRLALNDAYNKESRELNDLRKRYKSLAVQNKENTTEGKELLKNITDLDKKLKKIDDTVGQNQRSVGKYTKAWEGLNSTLGKLGIIALITKSLEFLGNVFSENREGALALEIAFSKFTVTAKVFINSVINSFEGVKDLFNAVSDSFDAMDLKIFKAFKSLKKLNPFADQDAIDKEIEAINAQLVELEKSSASDAIDKITKAFEGNIETTSEAIDAQEEYLELQLKTRISIEQQEKALAGLAEKRQILQDISDDDTIGFVTRTEAVKKAQEAAIEFAALENRLALTKEKLTIDAVKQDLREAKELNERQLAQIQTGEQLQKILQDSELARKVSDTNDEAFTAAFVERRDKQAEAEGFARDQEEKNRKTARDAFEQQLDIIEEFTEKRIASNDKIISSDQFSIEERMRALQENQSLEKELLDESIRLILEQGAASIDLRKDLTESEKEQQKTLLLSADIQKIINEQDAQEVFNLIRKLDLGEIEEKRLKETLKIKQETNEANNESVKILKKATEDELKASDDLFNKIESERREGAIDAEKDREKNRRLRETDLKLQAAFELNLHEEGSEERILIAEKLKNDLAAIERERVEDVEAANKKIAEDDARLKQERIDNAVEFSNKVFDALRVEISKRNEAINEALNNEIDSLQESIDRQIEANRAGGEEKLANDQAILAKTKLERQRELEAQAKQERLIALSQQFVNSVAAHSKDDPDGAIALALAETFAAQGIAQLIAGFEKGGLVEGPEQFIKINEKGQEFVVDAQTTKAMGLDRKGSTMVDFHKQFKEISTPQHIFKNIDPGGLSISAADYSEIVRSQAKSAEAITSSIKQNATDARILLDDMGRIVTVMQKGGVSERIIYESDSGLL